MAFQSYPRLVHPLSDRCTIHDNIHIRGFKDEDINTTAFDMTVPNQPDHSHLIMETIDRVPQTGDKGIYLKQKLKDKLIAHKQYVDKQGQDLLKIGNWKWGKT